MCRLGRINPVTQQAEWTDGRPKVGWAVRVGSIVGRTFSGQDWWQTTIITEILEDTPNMVRFKTGNSEYVWKVF